MIHALILCLAMQAASESAAQHEQSGLAALKAGQRDIAIEEFKRATELNPQDAQLFYALGIAHMKGGDYGSAIPALKRALELNPGLTVAHKHLGYALLAQGYAVKAVPELQAAGEKAGLGIAQLETGDLENAVMNLHAAVTAQPNDQDLLYYLARATGLYSKQLYDALLTNYPNTARGHLALAENYAALRQVPQAVEHYKAALKERPDLPGPHLALGKVYADASLWKEAEEEYRAEAKLEPGSAEAAYRFGSALLQDGNSKEALAELERADRLEPGMPETLYALGKANSMESNYAAAQKAWNRVIEMEKQGELASQAHFGLAAIYRKQGKSEDAAREMKAFQDSRQKPAE